MTTTLFSGLSLTSLLNDAGLITGMFTVVLGIYAAFWAGSRLIGVAKGLFRR